MESRKWRETGIADDEPDSLFVYDDDATDLLHLHLIFTFVFFYLHLHLYYHHQQYHYHYHRDNGHQIMIFIIVIDDNKTNDVDNNHDKGSINVVIVFDIGTNVI